MWAKVFRMWMCAVFLLGCCGVAAAQDASGCPVTVTDIRNLDTRIFVMFTNASTKRLDSYEFGLDFYGIDGKVRQYPETFKSVAHVGARKRFLAYWKSGHTLQFQDPGAKAYLLRATFSDGSAWADDGSHSCGAAIELE
jgi:hypothetical protein